MGDQVNFEVTVTVSRPLETIYVTTKAKQFVDNWETSDCNNLVLVIDTQDIRTTLGTLTN